MRLIAHTHGIIIDNDTELLIGLGSGAMEMQSRTGSHVSHIGL